MLRDAAKQEKYVMTADIIRQIALMGCRRSEIIRLRWTEADTEASCLRLQDSKEGESIHATNLPVVEYLERRRSAASAPMSIPARVRTMRSPASQTTGSKSSRTRRCRT
jgi:integrase